MSLAKLVVLETPVTLPPLEKRGAGGEGRERGGGGGGVEAAEGSEAREAIWWRTWREMGCDAERGADEIWPVPKVMRGVTGAG